MPHPKTILTDPYILFCGSSCRQTATQAPPGSPESPKTSRKVVIPSAFCCPRFTGFPGMRLTRHRRPQFRSFSKKPIFPKPGHQTSVGRESPRGTPNRQQSGSSGAVSIGLCPGASVSGSAVKTLKVRFGGAKRDSFRALNRFAIPPLAFPLSQTSPAVFHDAPLQHHLDLLHSPGILSTHLPWMAQWFPVSHIATAHPLPHPAAGFSWASAGLA